MRSKALLTGFLTYIPGIRNYIGRSTGGTDTARYCYSVWLRHLIMATKYGLPRHPRTIAELGPGDSLGIGLAALLSGANTYYAFDVVSFAKKEKNTYILNELIKLFTKRASIPNEKEFPRVKPFLDSYHFPHSILTDDFLHQSLQPERIQHIRNTLDALSNKNVNNTSPIFIKYITPWYSSSMIQKNTIDMIFSQATLEHIDDLETTYRSLYDWLHDDGIMSHQIDFKCHGTANEWNGHWTYSDFVWKYGIRGNRTYLLNREPHSTHIKLLKKNHFHIVADIQYPMKNNLSSDKLSPRFHHITKDDLNTSGAFLIARKNNPSL